jgi:phosphatidylserine/phosphatidylglycerophosphate/cardiolipin synthase-like enzyme
MVLQFGSPLVTPAGVTRPVGPGDDRPERLLLDAVARNPAVNVKILISQPVIDSHLVATGAVLVPVVGAVLVLLVGGFLEMLGVGTTLDEVERYFEHSAQPLRNIKGATSSVFGPTHAKLAIVDGKTAVSIASPLIQGYYGDAAHAIDDPRRGNYRGIPVHDVSFAVTGPVVYDLHETYRLHWNVVASTDNQITPLPQPPPSPTDLGGLDAFASLQVVRTLAGGRFDDPKDGEKGVLEAYLRAIANAESFIYMENQYLTNDTIGTALLQALTDPKRPNLNVIVLVNIHPDVPGYSGWQRNLIDRIRQGMVKAGLSQESRKRFGVFTRWTHEAAKPPGQPRARIAPNYIHAKVAIVDNSIATLGSANLDGASLDYFQVLHALHFGDVRNSEVNFLVLNNIENQPETPVVDNLRRSLWAEHLGIEDAGGNPDPGNQMLALQNQPAGGWVELWRNVAAEKLEALKAHPENPVRVRVLPWPDAGKTLSEPREHLAALLGKPENALGLDTVAGTRRFSFKEGRYQDKTPDLG